MSNGRDCWNRERARRRDCLATRVQGNLPSFRSSAFPANSFFAYHSRPSSPTNHLANMDEMKDESDLDMLFDDDSQPSATRAILNPVGPQLSRPTNHQSVIMQIEAVFETVADALLNERADVTISLNSSSSHESRNTSARIPKAVFNFPGKTANDAWRFCR